MYKQQKTYLSNAMRICVVDTYVSLRLKFVFLQQLPKLPTVNRGCAATTLSRRNKKFFSLFELINFRCDVNCER